MLENISTSGSSRFSAYFAHVSSWISLKDENSSILQPSFQFANIGCNATSKPWIHLSRPWTASTCRHFLVLGVRSSRQMWLQLLLHYDKHATQTVHGLQKRFFDLKPTAGKGIRAFLSDVNNVNDQLRELGVTKAFEEDAIISKVLSSLPHNFFYFNSAWDSTSEQEKTLLNLSERLIKEEEKLKHAVQNPVDITKAFYSRSPSRSSPPSSTGHLCIGAKCPHSSHSATPKPTSSSGPSSLNADGTPLTYE
jgi:hypothetical protein